MRRLRSWWYWHRPAFVRDFQWPWVTRRWATKQAIRARSDGLHSADEELAKVKAALDPVIRKGTRIRAGLTDTPLGETYRCQVDFDPYLMRQMFTFGNDHKAIEIVAERLAYQVAGEIKRLNWHRFSEDEEARRRDRYFYPETTPVT